MRRVRFPTLDDIRERLIHHLNEHVDVIGHDTPGDQAVTLSIEVFQRVLSQSGNPFVAQIAGTFAAIRILFDPFAQFHCFF